MESKLTAKVELKAEMDMKRYEIFNSSQPSTQQEIVTSSDHQASRAQVNSVQRLDDDYLHNTTEDSRGCVLKTEPVSVNIENISEESNLVSNISELSNETRGWYVPSQSNDGKVLSASTSSFKPPISMFSCHSYQSPILNVKAEANCSSLPALPNNLPPIPLGEVSLSSFATLAQDPSFPVQVTPSIHRSVASAGFKGSSHCPLTSARFKGSDHSPMMSAGFEGLAPSPLTSVGFRGSDHGAMVSAGSEASAHSLLMSAASQSLALPTVSNDKESACRSLLPSAYNKQHSVPCDILWTDKPHSQLNESKGKPLKRNYKKMVSVGVQCRCLFIPIIKTEPLDADNEISPAVSSNLQSSPTDNDIVPNSCNYGDKNFGSCQNLLCENEIGFTKERDNHVSTGSWLVDGSGTGSKVDEHISGPDIRDLGRCSVEHSTPMIIDPAQNNVESQLGAGGLEMDVSCADLTDGESSGLEEISDAGSFGDVSLANMLGDASRPTFSNGEIDAISEETTIVKCEEDASADMADTSFVTSSDQQKKLKGAKRKSVPRLSGRKNKLPDLSSKRLHRVHGNKKKMLQLNQDDMQKETSGRRPIERNPGRKVPQQNNQEGMSRITMCKNSKLWEVSPQSSAWKKRSVSSASPQGQVVKKATRKRKRGRRACRKSAEINIPETSSQCFKVLANEKEVTFSGSGQDDLDEEKLQPVILRSGRKRFNCQHCSKCFSSASQCALHEKEAHVFFTCDECSEALSSKEEVHWHYSRKHKGNKIRFSKQIAGGSSADERDRYGVSDEESVDSFQAPDDIESDYTSGKDYDSEDKNEEEEEELDYGVSQQRASLNSVRDKKKEMMDKQKSNPNKRVDCDCGKTYLKKNKGAHLRTMVHKRSLLDKSLTNGQSNSNNKLFWYPVTVKDIQRGFEVKGLVKVKAPKADVECVQLEIQRTLMELMKSTPECLPASATGIENETVNSDFRFDKQRKGDTPGSPLVNTSIKIELIETVGNSGVNEHARENTSGGPNTCTKGKDTRSSFDEQFGKQSPGCRSAEDENMRGDVNEQVREKSSDGLVDDKPAGTDVDEQDRKNSSSSPVKNKTAGSDVDEQDRKNSSSSPVEDTSSGSNVDEQDRKNSFSSPVEDKTAGRNVDEQDRKHFPSSPVEDKTAGSDVDEQDRKNSFSSPVEDKTAGRNVDEQDRKHFPSSPVEDKTAGSDVDEQDRKHSSSSPVEDKTAGRDVDEKFSVLLSCIAHCPDTKTKRNLFPQTLGIDDKTDFDFNMECRYDVFDKKVIRSVCSKIKHALRKELLKSSSTHVYCLKARETTFNNSISGFVQLKEELTSSEEKQLQEKIQASLEEIHRKVRRNVPYQSEEAPNGCDISNTENDKESTGISHSNQLSTSSEKANNSYRNGKEIANHNDQLSGCITDTSDQLSTHMANSSADIADTGVKASNAKTTDTKSNANKMDKPEDDENSANNYRYLKDHDSEEDTNPGFHVDFFKCKDPVQLQKCSAGTTRRFCKAAGFFFNVMFDSLEKETFADFSEKLYNSLRVKLHRRLHEMCNVMRQCNSSISSDLSKVWAGHLDTREIDRDGVLRMLGKKDYKSKMSVDSWKIFKPMEKGKDFCYLLVVEDNETTRRKRKRTNRPPRRVEGIFLTQQEITDISSVESSIKKLLKQLDVSYERFSGTITTNSNPSNTEEIMGDFIVEAQKSEKEMTSVQEQCCIPGTSAFSSTQLKEGEEDSSGKAPGIRCPEKMLASGSISSLSDIPEYSVTLSKYCKCCYKNRKKDRCPRFYLSSVFIDENNLDDITLKIYTSIRMAVFRDTFLKNCLAVKTMEKVLQDLWDDKCDISVPDLLFLYKVQKKGIFWCEKCKVPLANNAAVTEHLGLACHSTRDQNIKTCPICAKSFDSHIILIHHRITRHHHSVLLPFGSTTVPCPHCPKLYRNNYRLTNHIMRIHQQLVEPVLCNKCGKLLQTKKEVIYHAREHSHRMSLDKEKGQRVTCPYCAKTILLNRYGQHLLTHENSRLHCCEICQKSFKTKSALSYHMQSHSDIREFACPECGQEFRLKHHMKSHLRRHTGDLFKCQVCQRPFTSKAHLNVHLRDLHPQKAEFYTCRLCSKEFSKLKFLNKHIEVVHRSSSDAVDSDKIDKPITSLGLDGQLFKCDHCNEKFTKKYYLRQHILSAHSEGDEEKNGVKNSKTQKVVKGNKEQEPVKVKKPKLVKASVDKDGNETKSKAAGKKQRKCNVLKDSASKNTAENKSAKRKASETRGSVKRIKMQHLRSSSERKGHE